MITGLLPLTDYISGAENETPQALSGHTNGYIEMRSPSAAAMMTMVAAATIVRLPPVISLVYCNRCYFRCLNNINGMWVVTEHLVQHALLI